LSPGFKLTITNVGLNSRRIGLINALKEMGARISVRQLAAAPEPYGDIVIRGSNLRGIRIRPDEVPAMIDELPLLALAAARARGITVISGAGELRYKESDRLKATAALFDALGLKIEIGHDKITIKGPQLISGGGTINTLNDHRIAMAAAVGSLLAAKPVKTNDPACVNKSYPSFFRDFKRIFHPK
jgi:3-phosphoshikimate 1-carboxyvinyltransferase